MSMSTPVPYSLLSVLIRLFSLFLLVTLIVAVKFPAHYSPIDELAVNCGFAGYSIAPDGRQWTGDIGSSKFGPSRKSVTAKAFQQLSDDDMPNKLVPYFTAQKQPRIKIPYFTARISRTAFTYFFSVNSPGPIFIRLHFFPSSYGADYVEPSKAVFSVKANQFTLLSNFSPSLSTNTEEEIIAREFCINLGDDQEPSVNITFTPSPAPSDAYAFINGIEIVSMPNDLYYGSDKAEGFSLIGNRLIPYHLDNNTALETVYRLNVGGRNISPMAGTGMYRKWSNDDGYYNFLGAIPVDVDGVSLQFIKIPNYTAPDEVYKTARSMGNNKTFNEGYNLTWNLPVDSGFTYMVRLHFCEFQPEITKPSDREFLIFMANQTAEEEADVISWSGGRGVPIYRDYAVIIGNQGKKQNLSVALHPSLDSITKYSDAILNGLEVFKLSNASGNLAGPNPDPPPPPNSKPTVPVAAVCGGVLSGLVVFSVIGLLILRRSKSLKYGGSDASLLPSDVCRKFSLAEIRSAVNDFDDVFIIGRGGFGDVYKGYISGGTTPVAIKRLKQGSRQGAHEFINEIEMLSQLRHLHLVSLIGYCNDGGEMILVYDFMSRGTLSGHLYNTDNPSLSWKQRLQICIEAAKGLHYLHAGERMIIHRDVKTTNILLDDNWVAKVSDFGLSKMNPNKKSNAHVSTVVKVSFEYVDPEYYRRQQLTDKSDVYSFGVVLLEALCARPAIITGIPEEQVSLAARGRYCWREGTFDHIVDPNLRGQIAPECLRKFGEIVDGCLRDVGIERPTMRDVVRNLEFALQLQEAIANGIQSEESCRCFSLAEIQSATNKFDDNLVIGKGGFGKVYKGFIDHGDTIVAIKRLNAESKQGAKEFWTEIMTLFKLRHTHLVTLIGYCNELEEMILVYEYMPNGTLAHHLYRTSRKGNCADIINHQFSWEERLKICIGAARGLDYLHTNTDQSVIHRDIKTTNILLDENWTAKISDFGLSKICTTRHTHNYFSTDIKGTFGYLDPDYFLTGRLTKKSDVYAFGVVLIEALCARPPVDASIDEDQHNLAIWAQNCIKKGTLDQIIDPSIRGQISPSCLKAFAEVASKCLHNHPKGRPTMAEVVGSLDLVLASHVSQGRGVIHNNIKSASILLDHDWEPKLGGLELLDVVARGTTMSNESCSTIKNITERIHHVHKE